MQSASLPYIDNAKAIIFTIVINLVAVFVFNWPGGVTYSGVMWDSLICAFITVALDMWFVYAILKKMRARGEMPAQAPENNLMQRLPQNPFLLAAVYAIMFAAITIGVNGILLWFFGIWSMAFLPWLVYKLIYSTMLSVKIIEFCIFRYAQPDWVKNGNTTAKTSVGVQLVGDGVLDVPRDTDTKAAQGAQQAVSVKNPMPKISVFNEMFGSVTGNLAMNIIMGSALGGVAIVADSSVVIHPTTIEGIPITGLIFGLIVGVLVTRGITAEMNKTITTYPAIIEGAVADKCFSWMPVKKAALMCFVCISVMIFSAIALPIIMALFGKSVMNFFQYTVFITVYATLISKPLSYALIRRCLQPDYIQHTLKKAGIIQ